MFEKERMKMLEGRTARDVGSEGRQKQAIEFEREQKTSRTKDRKK